MLVNYGGWVPLSMSDYPGQSATVIFLRGCSHGCPWCHNKQLQTGQDIREIADLEKLISQSVPFVSALVISGGEPLKQLQAVIRLVGYAQTRGLKVGLHTSGKPVEDLAYVLNCCHPDFVLIGGPNYDPTA